MNRKKGIDRENLIVDDIIAGIETGDNEGGENPPVKIVGSAWTHIKGIYLNNAKHEVKLISLFSLLNENQKERVFDYMLHLLELKFIAKENLEKWIEKRRLEKNETDDNRKTR